MIWLYICTSLIIISHFISHPVDPLKILHLPSDLSQDRSKPGMTHRSKDIIISHLTPTPHNFTSPSAKRPPGSSLRREIYQRSLTHRTFPVIFLGLNCISQRTWATGDFQWLLYFAINVWIKSMLALESQDCLLVIRPLCSSKVPHKRNWLSNLLWIFFSSILVNRNVWIK